MHEDALLFLLGHPFLFSPSCFSAYQNVINKLPPGFMLTTPEICFPIKAKYPVFPEWKYLRDGPSPLLVTVVELCLLRLKTTLANTSKKAGMAAQCP